MARRKARMPQGKKIQPAVKTMTFRLPPVDPGSGDIYSYIDLSQCASLLNRRFYRQGLEWVVQGFTLATEDGVSGRMKLDKIPDTWIASNAWEKSFRTWQKKNNEVLDEADSVRPRFLDYKVYMDHLHAEKGSLANLLPEDTLGNTALPGTWDYSKVHIPVGTGTQNNTNEFEIIWVGESFQGAGASGHDSVSMIEGYAASRALPDILDPNVPSDVDDTTGTTPENWMTALFNEGTDQSSETLENLIDDNNQAPYPFENMDGVTTDTQYPGGANNLSGLEAVCFSAVTATTIGGITYMPGGSFQGGLIKIYHNLTGQATPQPGWLLVHLAPGNHRGYMARSMTDV